MFIFEKKKEFKSKMEYQRIGETNLLESEKKEFKEDKD